MRRQRKCALVVRFSWLVPAGHSHPAHTFTCVEDMDMAHTVADRILFSARGGIKLVGVAASPDGGRNGVWEPLPDRAQQGEAERNMHKRALGTAALAIAVILTTGAASGGCGGGPGGNAPHVGEGGQESAPKDEPTSDTKTPNPSVDAQPRGNKTPNPPKEPPDKGHDPCNAHLDALKIEGWNVVTTLTVGPCEPRPKQYSGSLELQYGAGDLPNVTWHRATLIPVYTYDGQQKITAKCEDAYWVAVYETSGRDGDGKPFAHTYSRPYDENGIPRKVDCP